MPARPIPILTLLPVGLAVPPPLPEARWALTPPFHPCPTGRPGGRSVLCGAFPEACGEPPAPPGVTRHRFPVEPGLSSPAGAGAAIPPPAPVDWGAAPHVSSAPPLPRQPDRNRTQSGSRRPAASGQRPAASGQRPAASGQRPAASGQRPAASGQRPAASGQRPAASGQRPAASGQRPAASGQRPAASGQRPAASGQRPAASEWQATGHAAPQAPPRSAAPSRPPGRMRGQRAVPATATGQPPRDTQRGSDPPALAQLRSARRCAGLEFRRALGDEKQARFCFFY